MTRTVKGRYAPSPTGHQTVGNARTAILAWLDARSRGGTFVVRLDDTDPSRHTTTPDDITSALHLLGVDWDEGWDVGGPNEPYEVSERVDRHRERAEDLVDRGLAYWDYTPPIDDLTAHKKERGRTKEVQAAYRGSDEPVEGVDPVLRLRVPEGRVVEVADRVFGALRVNSDDIGEVALLRSDGRPTYHLASCVDDTDMGITSVVRGADWLNFLPVHVLLFEAFGASMPEFAHVPLLAGKDGQKLSKRHGDLSIHQLVEVEGTPGGALACYLSNLGFEDRSDLLTLGERSEDFDIGRLGRNSPRFDPKKLNSFSRRWLAEKEPDEAFLGEMERRSAVPIDDATARLLLPGVRTRVGTFAEAGTLTAFLGLADVPARDPVELDDGVVASLLATDPWEAEQLGEALDDLFATDDKQVRKRWLTALRDALAPGIKVTPPLHYMLAALGRDRAAARLGPRPNQNRA